MPFDGARVLSLESRRSAEIEKLIERQGGIPTVAPSVRERPLEEHEPVERLVEGLTNGAFDMVIFMTGVGVAFVRDLLAERGLLEALCDGLKKVTVVARGPKPVAVLRSLGITIHVSIPEPNTWREIVAAVAKRNERRIAIQEYGRPNAELCEALKALGAEVTPAAVYRWDLPQDTSKLRAAAHGIAAGAFDIVMFTSSVQIDHLVQIAAEEGIEEAVRDGLRKQAVIASIGPVMNEALASYGIEPDIVPEHPKMGALVKAAAEEWRAARQRKQNAVSG